jgi:hypothetical protein
VILYNWSDEKVTIDYEFLVKRNNGRSTKCISHGEEQTFHDPDAEEPYSIYEFDFMKRATFIKESSEYLVDGALVIELRMKLSKGQYQSKRYPRPSFRDFMVIRGDEETYDIAINVKGVLVKAHKLIIRAQAGDFYEMCEACSVESPMTIDDVDNVCFEIMINYLYGGDVYPAEWQEHSEAILKAPSKYGFTSLKEEAEAWSSNSFILLWKMQLISFWKRMVTTLCWCVMLRRSL